MSLPFFAGFGFAGDSGLFLLRGTVGFSGFLVRFLVCRFRGFIAHNNFMLRIDWPAAWKFLRRQGHRASDAGSCKVRVAPPFPVAAEVTKWIPTPRVVAAEVTLMGMTAEITQSTHR